MHQHPDSTTLCILLPLVFSITRALVLVIG